MGGKVKCQGITECLDWRGLAETRRTGWLYEKSSRLVTWDKAFASFSATLLFCFWLEFWESVLRQATRGEKKVYAVGLNNT